MVDLVSSGSSRDESCAAVPGIRFAGHEAERFETRDDLGDVGGIAAELLGQGAHGAPLIESPEHTCLRRAERQLGRGRLVGAVVYVDQVEQDGLGLPDDAIDGRKVDVLAAALEFAPGGLDAALVTVGGETAERSLRAIKSSGRIAWPNGVLPVPVTPPGATVSYYDGDRSRTATDRLNAIIEASSFEVHVARTFPMERVKDAHRALNDHYVGKLALKVG